MSTAKEQLSIHKALSELKLIDSKISKKIGTSNPTGLLRNEKVGQGYNVPRNEFESNVKSNHQSILDLMDRRNRLKKAIAKSNSFTVVKINGKEMTIVEAINEKSMLTYKKMMLERYKSNLATSKAQITTSSDNLEIEALKLASGILGKEVDKEEKTAQDIMVPFIEARKFELCDPLNVKKFIVELEDEIDNFESEIDFVLSEANALTKIEI